MPKKSDFARALGNALRIDDQRVADILDCELAGAIPWDPEEPSPPRRLEVVRLAPEDWQRKRGWLAKVVVPGDLILAVVLDGWTAGPAELRVSLLEEAVAAYNERQEINEIEADVDNAISSGLALCREEIDAEVQRGVQEERARCLAIMDWLLGSLPQGWDFARRFAKAARGKIASGAKQRGAGAAWTGADDLPNPEPEPFADANPDFPGLKPFTKPHPFVSPAPDRERPKGFEWGIESHGGQEFRALLVYPETAREIARRWEEEPGLRERIERAETYMRNHWPATLASGRDGVVQKLWRILTGKEQ